MPLYDLLKLKESSDVLWPNVDSIMSTLESFKVFKEERLKEKFSQLILDNIDNELLINKLEQYKDDIK